MTKFHVGLDLGQANDYTAVAVVEVAGDAGDALHVRHLERFRHTLYPDVADRVEALMDSPQLKGASELVIDATGVGPAVTDIFSKRGRSFKAVKIHGGDTESREGSIHRVPKRNLVSALQAALQTGTLKIASSLELAEVLRQELLNFRIKINLATGHDSYEHWREGDHDDLVLAAAMAVWSARTPPPTIIYV
jgi:Terminase RNaseH-like domain